MEVTDGQKKEGWVRCSGSFNFADIAFLLVREQNTIWGSQSLSPINQHHLLLAWQVDISHEFEMGPLIDFQNLQSISSMNPFRTSPYDYLTPCGWPQCQHRVCGESFIRVFVYPTVSCPSNFEIKVYSDVLARSCNVLLSGGPEFWLDSSALTEKPLWSTS